MKYIGLYFIAQLVLGIIICYGIDFIAISIGFGTYQHLTNIILPLIGSIIFTLIKFRN